MNISRFLPNYQIQNLFPKNRSFMSKNKKQSKQAEIPVIIKHSRLLLLFVILKNLVFKTAKCSKRNRY